ncbi:hypothetical protein BDV25DRAFT_139642 [Aspergillus avenaceus]|uniref:Uncharacterized protein n=1 Tax=Aspergillus avenaceus TaxID=36643 RepID=A0A5N6TWM5_ASPAV|nr:hypothetical protein BDV25DRAFT_139642 [Aspergillus avenaceus]
MADTDFFDGWIGKVVDFPSGGPWTLTELLRETAYQAEAVDYYKRSEISGGRGTFVCMNTNNETRIMQVYMQLPFQGSECAPAEVRGQQASPNPECLSSSEINDFTTLTENGCRSTPNILRIRYDLQDAAGHIPGGYIVFMLLNWLPGIRLSEQFFWKLPDGQRWQVRNAFKAAWLDCVASGICPGIPDPEHLLWDEATNTIYITEFEESYPADETSVWRDIEWIAWCMAKPPKYYRWAGNRTVHPDMSDWVL